MDRRAQLLHEFETIAQQKAGIAARLPALWAQFYSPPEQLQPAAQPAINGGGPSSVKAGQAQKRGLSDGPQLVSQDSKRLKAQPSSLDDLQKREEALLKEVLTVINKRLWPKKECQPFKEPVDPVKLRIPDYFTYIKQPMDLGTVRSKLMRKEYRTPMEACEDIRLVWRNCATYNHPGTAVRKLGDLMSEAWERAWMELRFEERWQELMALKDPASAMPFKAAQLHREIKSIVNSMPAGASNQSDSTTMSDLDKRRLSIAVSELQGEHLAQLINLLQADLPPAGSDGEVELDMDALPVATLYKMQEFLHSLTGGHGHVAPQQQAPGDMGGGSGMQHHPQHQHPQPHQQQQPPQHQPQQPQHQLQSQPSLQGGDTDSAMPGMSSGPSSPAETADSQGEVKGSTADDPHAKGAFVLPHNRMGVDESATAPGVQSSILRDRGAAGRKPDVHVNTAAWDVSALQPGAGEENGDNDGAEDDEMWVNFKSKEEQKRQQAEEQRKLKEQQEEELRKKRDAAEEEARRQAHEVAERERALAEEEARMQEEAQRARMQQCDKEVDEIKARAGTANLVQRDDMPGLIVQAQPSEGDLAAVGLTYKNDDDDVNFDED